MTEEETREKRKEAIDAFASKAIPTVFKDETCKKLMQINQEFDSDLMRAYHAGFCYALELVLNGDLNMKEIAREEG